MNWLREKILNNKSGRVSLLKLAVIGALAVIFLSLGLRAGFKPGKSTLKEAQASPSGGWLTGGYGYQKAIVIDNTQNASALSDYQVKVTDPIYNETGLVGSWHFEEAAGTVSGTVADSSGSGNNGTLTNMASPNGVVSAGKFGNGASFDGVNDYVSASVTGLPIGNSVRSMSAWFKTTQTPASYNPIITYGSADGGKVVYGIYLRSDGKVYSETGSGADQLWSATTKADGLWHYAVLDFDGSIQRLYVDGVLEQSTGSITLITPSSAVTTGKFVGSAQFFTGTIDEVKIYNRALTAAEIQAQYEAKAKPNYGDVRFTKSDGATELPYWMEKDGTFWVKGGNGADAIPASGTYTMYMYYGNPSATSASSGANTFEFFDDFSGDLGKWTKTDSGSNVGIVSNRLSIVGNGVWNSNGVKTVSTYTRPLIIEWDEQGSATDTGSQNGYTPSLVENSGASIYKDAVSAKLARYLWPTPGTLGTTPQTTNNEKHKLVVKPTSGYDFYSEGSLLGTTASGTDTNWYLSFQSALRTEYIDDIRVRKYASPEPTTNVYAEQENLKFAYQKSITLSPATPSANYQVKVTVGYTAGGDFNLGGNVKTDFSDIRFGDSAGKTYSYWRETYTASGTATFWVKVPNSGTSTIYIYYGNSVAASASNGANTFEFFDDFSGDLGKWTVNSGSIVSGELKFTSGQYFGLSAVYSTATFNPTAYRMDLRGKVEAMTGGEYYYGWRVDGTDNNEIYSTMNPNSDTSTALYVLSGGIGYGLAQRTHANANQWYDYSTWITGTTGYAKRDASQVSSANAHYADFTSANVGFAKNANDGNAYYDDIRVRKYASSEPAVTAAGAQTPWDAKANTYTYRKSVAIDNTGAGNAAQVNYQVPVTVDTAALITAGKMNADGSDIRFSATDNFNEENWLVSYPYWVESGINTATTKIWVKVDSLAAAATKTVYMYYGNAGAGAGSSGANTFEFFDDFNDNSIASMWSSGGSDYSESSGVLSFSGAVGGGIYITVPSNNYIVEAKIRPDSWGATYREHGLLARYNGLTGASALGHGFAIQYDNVTKVNVIDEQVGWKTAVTSGFTSTIGTWYNFKMAALLSGNTAIKGKAWVIGGLEPTWQLQETLTSRTSKTVGFFTSTTIAASYDDFRVRKYAATEPTAGTPEAEQGSVPVAPTNCVIQTPASTTQLEINWTDNSNNETSFIIERSTDGASYTVLTPAADNAVTATDTGRSANTKYWYRVAASNSGGASAYSTASPKYTLIESPTGITFDTAGVNNITLSGAGTISSLTGGSSGIYFSESVSATNSGWITANSWAKSGLTANTQYSFSVKTRNGDAAENSAVGPSAKYTLSPAPSVSETGGKLTDGTAYNTGFTFQNSLTFGAGGVGAYGYVWSTNAAYTWNAADKTDWTTGTITPSVTSGNSYYLYLHSYNSASPAVDNGTELKLGPYKYDTSAPSVSGFTLKGNVSNSEVYVNGLAASDNQVAKAVGIFNDTGGSSNLYVQFSEDQTNWGTYNGTVNQAAANWTYYKTITPSAVSQEIASAWRFATPDATKTLYVRVKDSAGNMRD